MKEKESGTLQTLDRGLSTIELVAQSSEGLTVAAIAKALGVHRAIAYRIVSTLETHAMVTRSPDGRVLLGIGIPAIAGQFMPQFRVLAEAPLRKLASDAAATAFIAVAEGDDCVAMQVEEPPGHLIRVGYRVGSRHALSQGAAGLAILAARPPQRDDPESVRQARADGYSLTQGQLQRGAVGVAVALGRTDNRAGSPEFSIGVVAMEDLDIERAIRCVKETVRCLDGLMRRA
ncbi:helix-turn-helix domain-containing protein [Bradyrhizobium sp. CSA207]|uniref:helix-turn-helix domain-containing protein n=1 Tax=Bradyrhizobium sp. CSA207 TaxID=2698826 RepID=UPI0023AFD5D0|nr:helix-turn-helix domain-containing protein [Bradyrhizobium sp. CSA207]MDE5444326.1 helix-turn-helix domain-containing protein [Bradyrhizobium sp. CSA207]